MNNRIIVLGLLLACAPLAHASSQASPLEQLARDTGMSVNDVRMLLGARTPHAQYRTSYDRKLKQFKQALGEQNYERLVATGRYSPLPYADATAAAAPAQSSPAAGAAGPAGVSGSALP